MDMDTNTDPTKPMTLAEQRSFIGRCPRRVYVNPQKIREKMITRDRFVVLQECNMGGEYWRYIWEEDAGYNGHGAQWTKHWTQRVGGWIHPCEFGKIKDGEVVSFRGAEVKQRAREVAPQHMVFERVATTRE